MLRDLVVDTNVLMHADNPNEQRQPASVAFLTKLLKVATKLRVDPGFATHESNNRSRIASEYKERLHPGGFGYAVLAKLLSTARVVPITGLPSPQIKRKVRQIISNGTDKFFLYTAIMSDEFVLVSHDFGDFNAQNRRKISRDFGVDVIEAESCTDRL